MRLACFGLSRLSDYWKVFVYATKVDVLSYVWN